MSIFGANKNIKETDVTYKGVELKVQYKIENDSFDHEFGTEGRQDHIEIHSVFCDKTDISEMLTEDQIESINQLINGEAVL